MLAPRIIKNSFGITLLELLITISVVGILASIGSTQYQMSVRKSRRAEAKLYLTSVYSLEKAFYSEYSAYMPSLGAIGFSPEGHRRFYYIEPCFDSIAFPFAGTISGYTGGLGTIAFPTLNMPWAELWSPQVGHSCGTFTPVCSAYPNDPQSFLALASGNLCAACATDLWTMDERKRLVNCSNGLR